MWLSRERKTGRRCGVTDGQSVHTTQCLVAWLKGKDIADGFGGDVTEFTLHGWSRGGRNIVGVHSCSGSCGPAMGRSRMKERLDRDTGR